MQLVRDVVGVAYEEARYYIGAVRRAGWSAMERMQSHTQAGAARSKQAVFRVARLALYVCIVFCVLVMILCLCGVASLFSAGMVGYYFSAPSGHNRVIPLDYNTAPLHTEWWRAEQLSSKLNEILPSVGELPDKISDDSWAQDEESPDEPKVGMATPSEMLHQFSSRQQDRHSKRGALVRQPQSWSETAGNLKLFLVGEYVDSIVASSTLLVPTRQRPSAFSEDGEVDVSSLFNTGPSMFGVDALYSGRLEIVVRQETAHPPRHLPLLLVTSVLFADDVRAAVPLHRMETLFERHQSRTLSLGTPQRYWMLQLVDFGVEIMFCVPLYFKRLAARQWHNYRSLPFPPHDQDTEVAVIFDVYSGFAPPANVRNRIRAINFTVFQINPDVSPRHSQWSSSGTAGAQLARRRVSVSRMTFHSSAQLSGLRYYRARYPYLFFVAVSCLFFSMYVAGFVLLMVTCGAAAKHYRRYLASHQPKNRREPQHDYLKREHTNTTEDSAGLSASGHLGRRHSSSFNSRNGSFSRKRSHLSRSFSSRDEGRGGENYISDPLEVEELSRSSSFHEFPFSDCKKTQ